MPPKSFLLPSNILEMFGRGVTSWRAAVQAAVVYGVSDPNVLTDTVFFLSHPERLFKPLNPSEKSLIKEWKKINQEIQALLIDVGEVVPPGVFGMGPRWLQYAQRERFFWRGTKEGDTIRDNLYFRTSPYWGGKLHNDGTSPKSNLAWCAAFVNWCLHRAGYSHTGSAGDDSFRNRHSWKFDALTEPKQGCVIVLGKTKHQRNSNHVSFLWSWKNLPSGSRSIDNVWVDGAKRVSLLGGNQSNQVCVTNYYKYKLFSVRGDNGVQSPYLWPKRGPATCSIDSVPTEHAHSCRHQPTSVAK